MRIIDKCHGCGNEISDGDHHINRRKFCSHACYARSLQGKPSNRDRRVTHACAACGKIIKDPVSKIRKFCSRNCYEKNYSRPKRIEIMCRHCGKIIETTAAKGTIYCSMRCFIDDRYPKATKPCLNCGKAISGYKPSQLAKLSYCSRDCAKSAWSNKIAKEVQCQQCGNIFKCPPKKSVARKFCSKKCANIWISNSRIVNPIVKVEANRIRRMIKILNNDAKCCICGWHEDTLDSCHIKAIKHGGLNTIDNMILLCPNHHRLWDRGKLPMDILKHAHHG